LDQRAQIDLFPLVKIGLQVLPAEFYLLGSHKTWIGLGFYAYPNFGGKSQGERIEATGTDALDPGFDPALHQDDPSRPGEIHPDLHRTGKMKAGIGGFPAQTFIQGSFVLQKGLLLPLLGYVFDSNNQGSKSSESNIKILIYNEMPLCQGKYLLPSLVLSPRSW